MRIFSVLLLMVSVNSFAAWQPYTTVEQVLFEGGDDGARVYVVFKDNFNPGACDKGTVSYKRINGNTQKGKYMISALLTAMTTGDQVSPNIAGCDDWGRAVVSGLRMIRS